MDVPSDDVEAVEQAWQRATDVDVVRALADLNEYPAAIQTFIQREAERRGVTANTAIDQVELPIVRLGRLIRTVLRFFVRHRFLAALVSGFVVRAAFAQLPRIVVEQNSTAFAALALINGPIIVASIAFLSRPLRSYKRVFGVSLFFFFGMVFCAAMAEPTMIDLRSVWRAFRALLAFPNPRRSLYPYVLFVAFLAPWIISCAITCAIVFVRNRFWPDYGPMHCAKCGYDLRGLPVPRCPECGTPFQHACDAGG